MDKYMLDNDSKVSYCDISQAYNSLGKNNFLGLHD